MCVEHIDLITKCRTFQACLIQCDRLLNCCLQLKKKQINYRPCDILISKKKFGIQIRYSIRICTVCVCVYIYTLVVGPIEYNQCVEV